jgi:hypothetical protein
MAIDANAVIAAVGAAVVVIVWLIRLEARVNAVDQQRAADVASVRQQREADGELNTERFDNIKASLDTINSKLDVLQQMKGKVDQIRSFIGGGHGAGV